MSNHKARRRRFFAGGLGEKPIFFDFWREKGAFTDPASSATFFCVAKLKVLLPRSMLLLLLQLLSWWAVSATAVPMARMHAAPATGATTTTAINSATRRRRRSYGGEFGELLLLPRPRAARLLEKLVLLRLRNVPISASG
jgi:hypothetical protein